MKMKGIMLLMFFGILLSPNVANSVLLNEAHFNTLSGEGFSFWNYPPGDVDTYSDPSAPSSSVLRFSYPAGFPCGNSVGVAYYQFPSEHTELYHQYYMKFETDFTFQAVGQKVIYIYSGAGEEPHHSFKVTGAGEQRLWLEVVGYDSLFSNTGYDPKIETGRWYKINIYEKLNTPGVNNGVFQAWLDDKMVFNYSNIPFRPAGVTKGIGSIKFDPIWGSGSSDTTPRVMHMYIDEYTVSTTPINGDSVPKKIPNPPESLKIQ